MYRELKRNRVNSKYTADKAQELAAHRRRKSDKSKKISSLTWMIVERLIRMDFSPDQISGVLLRSLQIQISHEWIYQYILSDKKTGGTLWKHLRWSVKKRRKRYGKKDRRGCIPGRVSIYERPDEVQSKSRLGDWEIDTATGKNHKGILVLAVERKTKLTLIEWVPRKTADCVTEAIIRMRKPMANQVRTITVDNGKEFAHHSTITRALGGDIYFAHPYSAWERGLNENTIGLIRQSFPKNVALDRVNPLRIRHAQNRLNIRPRKTMGFLSPYEAFHNAVTFETEAFRTCGGSSLMHITGSRRL